MNQASTTSSSSHQTTAACIVDQLRDRMESFEGLNVNGRELTLTKEIHRRFCKIFMFRLSPESGDPDLVVKVPVGHSDVAYQQQMLDDSFSDRPRLFDRVDPDSKSWKEYAALCRIQASICNDSDSRFGVVRVYDLLPEQQAMVMQWINQPSLRKKLYASHRFGNAKQADRLPTAFAHAGAWLQRHHQLPPLDHCETRNTTRDEFIAAVERFMAYLVDHVGNSDELRTMHQQINQAALDYLPARIPTGQVHGDYAPRNVFVDSSNRVSVFDTLGRFEAPIYEDIAKMLMTVNASGPQLLSGGMLFKRNRLSQFEDAFLQGYFGDQPIPRVAIQLFLAQLMLEHWAAVVYRHEQTSGLKWIAKGTRRAIWQKGFKTYLQSILATLGRGQSTGKWGST